MSHTNLRLPRALGQDHRSETVRLLPSLVDLVVLGHKLNVVQLLCETELWAHRTWKACGRSRLVICGFYVIPEVLDNVD